MSDNTRSDHDERARQSSRSNPYQELAPTTGSGRSSGRGRRAKRRPAEDPQACLDALEQLPGLLTMGFLTTQQANAMRSVYGTLLQHHQRSQAAGNHAQVNDADVMEMLRDNPHLLNMLQHVLTDEQIAAVMQAASEDDDDDEDDDGTDADHGKT